MMDLRKHATWWYIRVKEKYSNEIEDSIKRSKIYTGPIEDKEITDSEKEIHLVQTDSASCLRMFPPSDRKLCLLNYASYKNPGGGFFNGARSQEEALCHESTLYPVLEARLEDYYIPNRGRKNRGLYKDRAIYSPDIIFEHDGDLHMCDVITCAAPNWNAASRFVSYDENLDAMRDRVDFMYKACQDQGVDILIAGAWGCGVFRQDPREVCKMLIENKNRPSEVYFAIPDEVNFNAFKKVVLNNA